MQMLGKAITDPHSIESSGTIQGLDLLAIHTTMQPQKITRISSGRLVTQSLFGQAIPALPVNGYEIHVGDTRYLEGAVPFASLATDTGPSTFDDGCIAANNRIFGTYLHGLFDDDTFRHAFLMAARSFYGLAAPGPLNNWKRQREAELDRLTNAVREALDMDKLFSLAGLSYTPQKREEVQP
jgi:adenosylcobyric acid synthase